MHPVKALQEKVSGLGEFAGVVVLVNQSATRARRAGNYVAELVAEHPVFASAVTVATTASLVETVQRLRDKTKKDDDGVRIILPVGGDTTFNAAFQAAEGTNNIVLAMRAGNATNAAINLQKVHGRILKPHEVIEQGKVAQVHGIEMVVDGKRHLAATIADVGTFSRGAKALNTWLRNVPGYENPHIRDILHERILLVGYSALQSSIPVKGHWPDGTDIAGRTLGITVTNVQRFGHHAYFPELSMTKQGAFAFELPSRPSIPRYAKQIQNGTMPGYALPEGAALDFVVGKHALASVDGEHMRVEAGQRITQRLSELAVNVMCMETDLPVAA